MDARRRSLRRQQLDRQLGLARASLPEATPQGGWIKAVREALGLTLETFGRRLGISRQSTFQLERAEVDGSITLRRLRAAADALECDVVVVLVPRRGLEETVRARAVEAARKQLQRVGHTMAMEAQAVSDSRMEEMVKRAAEDMVERNDPRLWEA